MNREEIYEVLSKMVPMGPITANSNDNILSRLHKIGDQAARMEDYKDACIQKQEIIDSETFLRKDLQERIDKVLAMKDAPFDPAARCVLKEIKTILKGG